jgi:hypothetical protein
LPPPEDLKTNALPHRKQRENANQGRENVHENRFYVVASPSCRRRSASTAFLVTQLKGRWQARARHDNPNPTPMAQAVP